jgi:putative oxidoreductase
MSVPVVARRVIDRSAVPVATTSPRSTIAASTATRRRLSMNTALLVLRLVPGLLVMGHGLQKLVPPSYSPPLLRAAGHRATAGGFEQLGIRPSLPAAVMAGSAELAGGFAIAAGILTPVGTILVAAVMTTAILTVHARNGIWNTDGGFELPFLLLSLGFVVSALGTGAYSVNSWLGIDNWAGLDGSLPTVARAAIALAIGVAAGVVAVMGAWASSREPTGTRAGATG